MIQSTGVRIGVFLPLIIALGALGNGPPLAAAEQSTAQTVSVTVRDGTPVRLSLQEDISSATSKVGQSIPFRVLDDVVVNNMVVIPGGSPAVGHIVTDKHKKMLGKGGKVEFTLDSVTVGDTHIKVRASSAKQGQGKTGTAVTASVLLGPEFLIMHGKDAKVPRDTVISGYTDGDQRVQTSASAALSPAFVPSASTQPASNAFVYPNLASQGASAELPSEVTFKSIPAGAEIAIDGEFMGDTPSTVKVGAGHHNIVVTKTGFKTWQRTLNVSPGSAISLDLTLDRAQ